MCAAGRTATAELVTNMDVPAAKAARHAVVRGCEAAAPTGNTMVIREAIVADTVLRSGNLIPHNAVTISEVSSDGKIVAQHNVGDLYRVNADQQAPAGS